MVTIKNATRQDILIALDLTNKEFNNNVEFNRFDSEGKRFYATLRVKDSSKEGARRGFTGRKMINGCWHVYGTFFDKLFSLNESIIIISAGQKITKNNGNWIDRNIGSIISPLMYSSACECD